MNMARALQSLLENLVEEPMVLLGAASSRTGTMSYCKHVWKRRSELLRTVFASHEEPMENDFFVCGRCLRIEETRADTDDESRADAA